MPGVSVEAMGLHFILWVLRYYWSGILYFLFFPVCLLVLLILKKKEIHFFIPYLAALTLTIYNPWVIKYVWVHLHSDQIYYRFLWMLPVGIVISALAVELIRRLPRTWMRAVAAVLAAFILIRSGSPVLALPDALALPENFQDVPDDLVELCRMIHEDAEIPDPCIIVDQRLHFLVRQYDPSIRMALKRDYFLYYNGSPVTSVNEDAKSYRRHRRLMNAAFYGEVDNKKWLRKAMRLRRVHYMAVHQDNPAQDIFLEIGCTEVGRTGDYILYRTFVDQVTQKTPAERAAERAAAKQAATEQEALQSATEITEIVTE